MKYIALILAIMLAFAKPAQADELAAYSNLYTLLISIDAYETRSILVHPGTFEVDPLAKPFMKTDLGAVAYVGLTSAAYRFLFRNKLTNYTYPILVELYGVGNNARILISVQHHL